MPVPSRSDSNIGTDVKAQSRAGRLALAGVIGPALFTTLVVVQGFLQPDYGHVMMPISPLTAWPAGWIQILQAYPPAVTTRASRRE